MADKPIKVSEQMPPDGEDVLMYMRSPSVFRWVIGQYYAEYGEVYYDDDSVCSLSKFSHWMPLPDDPEDEG